MRNGEWPHIRPRVVITPIAEVLRLRPSSHIWLRNHFMREISATFHNDDDTDDALRHGESSLFIRETLVDTYGMFLCDW